MNLTFRQGVVSAPESFIVVDGDSINIVTYPQPSDPLIVTFADQDTDYTIQERSTVIGAWTGVFEVDVDYWLYWDIDVVSGVLSRGYTTVDPVVGPTPPLTPVNGQHWFNTETYSHRVYNEAGNRWVRVIRTFAAKLTNGAVLTSMGINAPLFTGSQIGSNVPTKAGGIVYDINGFPIKRANGTFYTTETIVRTGIASNAQGKLAASWIEATAQEPIPAYSVVQFNSPNQIVHASSFVDSKIYGIIEQDLDNGDAGVVAVSGVVHNTNWNWSESVGTALYINQLDGTLTTTRPATNAVSVARVLTPESIIFSTRSEYSGDDSDTYLDVDEADALYVRLDGTSPLTASLDLDGNAVVNLAEPTDLTDAATKSYVDTTVSTSLSTVHDNVAQLTFADDSVQTTAYSGSGGRMLMIDTSNTADYEELGTSDRPFRTFAAAIAHANSSGESIHTFVLMGCTVTEDVDFTGTQLSHITISTVCRAMIEGDLTIANAPNLTQLVIRNVEIGGDVNIIGDGSPEQLSNTSFFHTSFSANVSLTALNSLALYGVSFFGLVSFTNLSYLYINGAQFNNDWTITVDSDGIIPSRGLNPGTGGSVSIAYSFIANNVYFVKGGTGAFVFQPHMSRLGRTTGTYTIPVGWTVSAYGTVFRGTWTNDGSLGLKSSATDNPVSNVQPVYSSIIGGNSIVLNTGAGTPVMRIPATGVNVGSDTPTLGSTAPAAGLEVTKWIRATVDGVDGYIPFFSVPTP